MRLHTLSRRGCGLCELGKYVEAKEDYVTALALSEENASEGGGGGALASAALSVDERTALQDDLGRIEGVMHCTAQKKAGDAAFGGGDAVGAIGLYTKAMEWAGGKAGSLVTCLSNRAACHIALGDTANAVVDCTAALDRLRSSQGGGGASLAYGTVPPPGSDARRLLELKLLVRRAHSHVMSVGDGDGEGVGEEEGGTGDKEEGGGDEEGDWECEFCAKGYATESECEKHEVNCPENQNGQGSTGEEGKEGEDGTKQRTLGLALEDYEAALCLDPTNETLRSDAAAVRARLGLQATAVDMDSGLDEAEAKEAARLREWAEGTEGGDGEERK